MEAAASVAPPPQAAEPPRAAAAATESAQTRRVFRVLAKATVRPGLEKASGPRVALLSPGDVVEALEASVNARGQERVRVCRLGSGWTREEEVGWASVTAADGKCLLRREERCPADALLADELKSDITAWMLTAGAESRLGSGFEAWEASAEWASADRAALRELFATVREEMTLEVVQPAAPAGEVEADLDLLRQRGRDFAAQSPTGDDSNDGVACFNQASDQAEVATEREENVDGPVTEPSEPVGWEVVVGEPGSTSDWVLVGTE